jgi:hypothetical protein
LSMNEQGQYWYGNDKQAPLGSKGRRPRTPSPARSGPVLRVHTPDVCVLATQI